MNRKITEDKILLFILFLSFCSSIFFSPLIGVTFVSFVVLVRMLMRKLHYRLWKADIILMFYFLLATIVYLSQAIEIKNYYSIVLFPFLLYVVVSTLRIDSRNFKYVGFYCLALLLYSILILFRDSGGNFNMSISENVFMNQRMVAESHIIEGSKFFMNATLASIWLVTFFIFSLCLYNKTKKFIYLGLVFLSLFFVFLSNTRSAIAASVIIIGLNYLILNGKSFRWLLTMGFLIAIIVPLSVQYLTSIGLLSEMQISRFSELSDSSSSNGLGQREFFWQYSLLLVYKNIWGYGHHFVFERLGYSVHNEYLGQMVSVGVVAALLYFIFIGVVYINKMRILRNNNSSCTIWNQIVFYMLTLYFIAGFTEQISFGNKLWIALLFLAIALSKQNSIRTT